MGEGQGERLADEAATRNQDIAAQGIGHGFALEHFSASRKGKDPPCGEAMGRWQREALTEGPVAHRRCPPPLPFPDGPPPHGFAAGRLRICRAARDGGSAPKNWIGQWRGQGGYDV